MYVIGSLKCFLYSVSILGINIHNRIIVFIHHPVYIGIQSRAYSAFRIGIILSSNKEKYFIIIFHYKFLSIQTTCTSVE